MSKDTKKLLDDLAERLGSLNAEITRLGVKKELTIEYLSNSDGVMAEEDDEFSRAELETEWHAELVNHGLDSYGALSYTANSDRVWALYQSWCQERERQQQDG